MFSISKHERLLQVQEPAAASEWIDAEVHRWRSRTAEHSQPFTGAAICDYHGFRHLPPGSRFDRVLAFGGGDGAEVLPLLDRSRQVTVIDASGLSLHPALAQRGARMKGPSMDGLMPDEPDGAYDLITCFGVLTYLPDPIASFAELRRCLAPGGWLLVREPIVAMNLEQPEHKGLGKHGRGIPLGVFDGLVRQGFAVHYRALCPVALTSYFRAIPGSNPQAAVRVDAALARLLAWNVAYRKTRPWHYLRPKAAAYVLRKR